MYSIHLKRKGMQIPTTSLISTTCCCSFCVYFALNYEPCRKEFGIGLSRVKWQWSDQGDFYIQNWKQHEPNGGNTEQCVEMSIKTGQWNDESCNKTKTFICYDGKMTKLKHILIHDLNCVYISSCCCNCMMMQNSL